MIAILAILLVKWYQGDELSLSVSFALIAMIYFLFMNVNNMAFAGIQTWTQFFAVLERLSEVFAMEEHKRERIVDIDKREACIKLENASYTWGFRVKENQAAMKK